MIKNTKNTKTKAAAPAKVSKPVVQTAAAVKPAIVAAPAVKAAATPAAPVKPVVPVQPKVRLEFTSASARSVAVAGSFNAWKPEPVSQAAGKGSWVKELTVAPGRYEYLFVVDGQWLADPQAKESVPNPFGGQNSVFISK